MKNRVWLRETIDIALIVASVGMSVVGAVSEKENPVVHTGMLFISCTRLICECYDAVAALVAFGSYLTFMIGHAEPTIGSISMAIKRGVAIYTILGVVAVVTPIILCILNSIIVTIVHQFMRVCQKSLARNSQH